MNEVILMGRLTKDPELRYTSGNNTAVCSFTLAVDRQYKQEGQPDADFFPIVAWSKLAETCGKFLEKGRRIVVIGRLQTRSWEDNDKVKRYVTEVVIDEMHFADDKKKEGAGSTPPPPGQQQNNTPPPAQTPTPSGAPTGGAASGAKPPWMK